MEVRIQVGHEFIRQFKRLAKKYHSLRDDFEELKGEILKNPFVGDDLICKAHTAVYSLAENLLVIFKAWHTFLESGVATVHQPYAGGNDEAHEKSSSSSLVHDTSGRTLAHGAGLRRAGVQGV